MNTNSFENLIISVKEVGELLFESWPGNPNKYGQELKVEIKSDGSSVTSADLEANRLLQAALSSYYPNEAIISEESPLPKGKRAETVWIIDPLDGTQSFIDGKNDFSILVAQVVNCQVQKAIMHFPALNITALAEKGKGAQINGQKAFVSPSSVARANSVYIRNFDKQQPCFYTKRMDSGRAFLAIATGEFDGVIMGMGRHNEWDLAAPALVIEEAGGKITDEQGHPIKFNQPEIYYKYFVASNGKVHEELMRAL